MNTYNFKINGNEYNVAINAVEGDTASVTVNGVEYQVEIENKETPVDTPTVKTESHQAPVSQVAAVTGKTITSPLPGVIIDIKVSVGDKVSAGQEIAVLEAMKMENSIEAEHDGTVTAIHIKTGDTVLEGAAVISIC